LKSGETVPFQVLERIRERRRLCGLLRRRLFEMIGLFLGGDD
jgi:hypothetical protein